MELAIKQLKQQGLIFVPLTTAEAVLVKDELPDGNTRVITLDTMLDKKIELIITPAGSGLDAKRQGKNVILIHSNSITPNESPSAVKIKYDNRGHIVETSPTSNMNVIVDDEGYFLYNGSEEEHLLMGDDFGIDENKKIILKWNNL